MTEQLYVLGHPVAHSKSPDMHNAAYRALGLDWEYGFMDCATEGEAQSFVSGRAWKAVNITMPWKPLAYAAASERTTAARLAQGANVLVNRGGDLWADNTDGKGCTEYLRRCGFDFADAHVAVCGTGPTALAIMHACVDSGAAGVALLSRDRSRARTEVESYLERLGEDVSSVVSSLDYAGATEGGLLAQADLIVDATPLGMKPGDPAPFDVSVLSSGQTVFDVVYGHGQTALIAGARAAGCSAYDGSGMLVAQAVETVRDIVDVLALPVDITSVDLFDVMHDAAFS